MTSPFDDTEFIDRDVQKRQPASAMAATSLAAGSTASHPLNREEIETRVGETQDRLAELQRAQEELLRKRTQLEEARRRQAEFETGRTEVLENLTRGVGVLEDTEFKARRDAEQMAKTLADFKEALEKVQAIDEKNWTKESVSSELTKALTTIDNARMEWNSSRMKWPILSGEPPASEPNDRNQRPTAVNPFAEQSMTDLLKLGLALTWPLALVALGAVVALIVLLARR